MKYQIEIEGSKIGFQFNGESSGTRVVKRDWTRCKCGTKIIRFKGMVIEIERDGRFTCVEYYRARDRHSDCPLANRCETCEKPVKGGSGFKSCDRWIHYGCVGVEEERNKGKIWKATW